MPRSRPSVETNYVRLGQELFAVQIRRLVLRASKHELDVALQR